MPTTLPSTLKTTASGPGRAASDPALRVAERVRQAFTLSGVVPLGVFVIAHLAMNASAVGRHGGGAAFAATLRTLHRSPALPLVEALVVFAPLVFHGALGLWLVATRRTLEPAAPYSRVVRVAMRGTGVVVLAFLAMHLPELRFRAAGARLDGGELATVLDADLSTIAHGVPWRALFYLVGTACVTFHFVCGLWGFFAVTQPGRTNPVRLRRAAWGAAALGLAMWAGFADVVVLRATGAPLFGGGEGRSDAASEAQPARCPPPR